MMNQYKNQFYMLLINFLMENIICLSSVYPRFNHCVCSGISIRDLHQHVKARSNIYEFRHTDKIYLVFRAFSMKYPSSTDFEQYLKKKIWSNFCRVFYTNQWNRQTISKTKIFSTVQAFFSWNYSIEMLNKHFCFVQLFFFLFSSLLRNIWFDLLFAKSKISQTPSKMNIPIWHVLHK